MQTYYDAIDAQLDVTAGGDRQIQTADAVYFDILDTPVRLWAGIGSMITPDGQRWHGFMGADENGEVQSLFHIEPLGDVRDGAAPLYEMSLHFLDEATFLELRDMAAAKVKGRDVLFYSVLLPKNGTRALTPPGMRTACACWTRAFLSAGRWGRAAKPRSSARLPSWRRT